MLIFLAIVIGLLALTLPAVFVLARRSFREQKDYERGLKMVTLLIHLPPPSDDIEGGGRDARDLVDENISKAQVIYNIVAGTVTKGFKSKLYGQRHFSFEIVGTKGFVNFYAAVPVVLADVVRQAIVSAYSSARVEEVKDHNIFSSVGKLSGTAGGELSLKENYAYPIASYQETKQDVVQAILNALSSLEGDDGVAIQILLRPAEGVWRKNVAGLASKKRKGQAGGTKAGEATFGFLKDLATAFNKPPEHKDASKSGNDISSGEQATIDAMEAKTQHPGFEVMIRVVASSNISQKAQALVSNVKSAFALFDAPGKNGFKYTPAKDMKSFIAGYVLRMFPHQNKKNVLNSVELASLFHFPDQRSIPTSQLQRQDSKQVDGPRNVPNEGTLLGYNVFRGVKKAIRLGIEDRRRHIYAVGQTGTGKSTFLENLAVQDMLEGRGLAFVDPHGDTAEKLLGMVPKERTEDVIYFCPAEMEFPLGLNLFEHSSPQQRDFLIQEAINMLYKLYDPQRQGIIGPRYEHWFRNAAQTIMADPEGGTFIDIPKVFTDNEYAKQKLKHVTDRTVLDFWNKEMAQTSDYHKSEILGWFVSKFGAFLSNEMMRNIIGQTKSSLNLREIMDEKKILLVNLSKGRTGDLNSKLLGMIFVMQFQAAAMSRANIPEDERVDFALYVDEFQNFSTDSFATIMSEARKYRLNLIVANQFTTQLTEEIRDAVFGNIGTIVSFRVGTNDVDTLTRYFTPSFDADDLLRVPNFNAIVRTMIKGIPTQPFSMAALPPLATKNSELADALKQLSAAKYGRPKAGVEKDIFDRLATPDTPASSPAANRSGLGAGPQPPQRPRRAPAQSGSFLDDWLRKKGATAAPGAAVGQPNAQPVSASNAIAQSHASPAQQQAQQPSGAAQGAPVSTSATPQQLQPAAAKPNQTTQTLASSQPQQAMPATASEAPKQVDAPNQQAVATAPDATKATQKSEGEVNLRSTDGADASSDDDDTIFIDKEGVIHGTDDEE